MLQIRQLCKEYRTGDLVQKALDHVDLNLRDNEFVAILGPSGSGKTTLLNIIGGLDRYDSGDLIINGISTKEYKDRDWDSYRNHTIGFVFQSYNLIPHQTVLSNVELALTISGIGKGERRRRAVKALEQVGLGSQLHKKPNQMSGGQMQRVAIARALVNDPSILLADEPTGALDSDTSVQVMDLLKEVAKERLVVMVTHNPDLAKQYATRIVNLRDGKIRSDSHPFQIEETLTQEPEYRNMGKASMSFLTALALSFHNLRTKKARTLLTAFAGSIGIIGISLILALSTGVNDYIKNVERDTLSQYPLQIQSTGFDFTSMLTADETGSHGEDSGQINVIQMVTNMFSKMDSNDLESLKKYLDGENSGIDQYVTAIEYTYDAVPQIYLQEESRVRQVNPDNTFAALGFGSQASSSSMISSMMGTDVFYGLPENASLYQGQYDVKAGHWPENDHECVLVLTSGGGISDFMLYTLGLRDSMELEEMIGQFIEEVSVETPEDMGSYSYEDILGITFKLVHSKDYYEYDSTYQVWRDKSDDEDYIKQLVNDGEDVEIVGIVQPAEDANGTLLKAGIAYPASLTRHIAEVAADSTIVKKQLSNRAANVFTNEPFGDTGSQNDFDLKSLFTIDEKALQNAFDFDADQLTRDLTEAFDFSELMSLDGTSLDLSGMLDLQAIALELPQTSEFSLQDLIEEMDLNVSASEMEGMVSDLYEGYQEYTAITPLTDSSGLENAFRDYLNMDEAQQILSGNMQAILEEEEKATASPEQIQQLFREILTGYQDYAHANGYTDPARFDDYLMEYLQTPQGLETIQAWSGQIFHARDESSISEEQLETLTKELAAGYQSYAESSNLPSTETIGDSFIRYLETGEAQKRLTEDIGGMIDTKRLQEQLSAALESGLKERMASYSEALAKALEAQISSVTEQITNQISDRMQTAMGQAASRMGTTMEDALRIDPDAFSDAFTMNMDMDELAELLRSMGSAQDATYENNLKTLGYVDFEQPNGIDIYPVDFESKEQIAVILDDYNRSMEEAGKEEQVITYTDMVGTLMSSVTDIINIISYVLIAFVAISLVVSSIMIGVITYISVLERKKEIGILRAIGASKGNISQVFNAETFIIGLCAGLMGIGLTLLILIPGNALIHHLAGTDDIRAALPPGYALILVLLSILLTLLGGLIPSRKAAKSDPVTALRTE